MKSLSRNTLLLYALATGCRIQGTNSPVKTPQTEEDKQERLRLAHEKRERKKRKRMKP